MGANSHVAIEYRPTWLDTSKSKYWYVWSISVAEARDYILYALAAQVRGEYKTSYKPRGIPADASSEVTTWLNDAADHSFSWLTPIEFHTLCGKYEKIVNSEGYNDSDVYPLAEEWRALAEVLLVLSKHFGVNNVRVVFGFDN